jgi:hypothetical protein
MNDAFDPANLKLSPEHVEEARRNEPRVSSWSLWHGSNALRRSRAPQIALALLYQSWRQGKGRPVSLSNAALEAQGVSRYAKTRALQKLETLGLITVERGKGQTPSVTIIHK